jgi:hypothetical protein
MFIWTLARLKTECQRCVHTYMIALPPPKSDWPIPRRVTLSNRLSSVDPLGRPLSETSFSRGRSPPHQNASPFHCSQHLSGLRDSRALVNRQGHNTGFLWNANMPRILSGHDFIEQRRRVKNVFSSTGNCSSSSITASTSNSALFPKVASRHDGLSYRIQGEGRYGTSRCCSSLYAWSSSTTTTTTFMTDNDPLESRQDSSSLHERVENEWGYFVDFVSPSCCRKQLSQQRTTDTDDIRQGGATSSHAPVCRAATL